MIVFLGGFGLWASTAPLSGATIAGGYVAAAGQNILIQHLEGGIIKSIHAREGDRVKAGQPLITLDPTLAEAQLNRMLKQLAALRAKGMRLEAERDLKTKLVIPAEVAGTSRGLTFPEVIAEQQVEFNARYARYVAEHEILNQRIAALKEAITGLDVQKKASSDQLTIVREEIDRKKLLLDSGLTNRSEYTALLRAEAELIGQVGSLQSQIASSSTQIVETKQQMERLTTTRVEEAVAELNTERATIADVEEQARAASSVLDRTVIRAPANGIIVRSVHNAVSSVVRAGEPIMELLPTSELLVIEARISPHDIDTLRIGQASAPEFLGAQRAHHAASRRHGDLHLGRPARRPEQRPAILHCAAEDHRRPAAGSAAGPGLSRHAGRDLHRDRGAHVRGISGAAAARFLRSRLPRGRLTGNRPRSWRLLLLGSTCQYMRFRAVAHRH